VRSNGVAGAISTAKKTRCAAAIPTTHRATLRCVGSGRVEAQLAAPKPSRHQDKCDVNKRYTTECCWLECDVRPRHLSATGITISKKSEASKTQPMGANDLRGSLFLFDRPLVAAVRTLPHVGELVVFHSHLSRNPRNRDTVWTPLPAARNRAFEVHRRGCRRSPYRDSTPANHDP